MDNQDKLYQQFKDASQKAPEKDFPAMEKVWGRIEEKLDKKALTKESKLWKKIAVAASILLMITLGSQFLKLENDKNAVIPETEIVTTETEQPLKSEEKTQTEEALVSTEKPNPIIKENAAEIMNAETEKQQSFVVTESVIVNPVYKDSVFENNNKVAEISKEKSETRSIGYSRSRPVYKVNSVQRNDEGASFMAKSANAEIVAKKQEPLYVLDGKAATGKDAEKMSMTNLKNDDDVDSIEVFTEPLYVINGVQYSEEDLFGPNPTSPYTPLNKQEILSTKILKGKEATAIYGEKGKKGVIIITTKNNKPSEKKK